MNLSKAFHSLNYDSFSQVRTTWIKNEELRNKQKTKGESQLKI